MHPMDVEVLGQESSADHADTLLHPACRPELPHASIHHGESCLPLLPSLERFGILPPFLCDTSFARDPQQ